MLAVIALFFCEVAVLIVARYYLVVALADRDPDVYESIKRPSIVGNFFGFLGPLGSALRDRHMGQDINVAYWLVVFMLIAMPTTMLIGIMTR